MKRRFLSSVNRPVKYIHKRYEKDMDNRFKTIKLSRLAFNRKIKNSHRFIQTSVYELCKLEHFDFKVTRPFYDVVFIDKNETRNYSYQKHGQYFYFVGTKNLKKDNLNVRILEQLTYTLASYEAWESLNQRTVFYYTLEEDYYQKHKEKFVRLELEEHDGTHVYYKYNPAWKTT